MAANISSIAGNFLPRTPLGFAALLLSLALQVPAARGGTEENAPLAGDATLGAVEVLTVKPPQIAQAVLMPNAQAPTAPPPLDSAALQAWLGQQGSVATGSGSAAGESGGNESGVPAAPAHETIVLGPATPSVADRAHLVLTEPTSVHPETTIEFAGDAAGMASGMAAVKLKVREGETCLLDFAVSATGPGVYAIAADSERREFDDPHGALRHVLIGVKAEAGGWTTVRLQRSGAGYHLHSVAITRAK